MADLLDKAILIGMGLERKAREVLEELEKSGKGSKEATGEAGLPPREAVENRVVDEGVRALKEFLSVVSSAKEKLEKEVTSSSGKVFEKLNVATQDELEVVKEMARLAREKVDKLEKRVSDLEARLERNEFREGM
ncbi:MAG: accessory factor UbiK family protein [Candidatus Methylomirabilis sp.]|nr:accessory factor UbiK family protein [Deltaproteobacteria bacterium]